MNLPARIEQALARGNLREASSLAGEWCRAEPGNPAAVQKAADIAFRRFEFVHAARLYRECLALDSARWPAWLNLAFCERLQGYAERWREALENAVAHCPDRVLACRLHSNMLVHLHGWPSLTQDDLVREIRQWASQRLPPTTQPPTNPPHPEGDRPDRAVLSPAGRLRIGYVSGNWPGAILPALLPGVLAEHDPTSVAPTLISTSQGLHQPPAVFARLDCAWQVVRPEALAESLAGRFDVLVDLDGHTPTGQLPAWQRGMAPVQLSWLDWFNTTGHPAFDGYVSDPVSTPEAMAESFTERLWLLPFFRLPYRPPPWLGELSVLRLPSTDRRFTFGCYTRLDKLHDELMASWARILAAVPGSLLVLKSGLLEAASVQRVFADRFARHGIERDRLVWLGKTDYRSHLEAYRRLDLVLDTWPYNGGVSSFDALAMGVPVLTMLGATPVARQTAAILADAGIAGLTASSAADYVDRAIAFGRGDAALPGREQVRAALLASPAVDGKRFARALESIYFEAVRAAGSLPRG